MRNLDERMAEISRRSEVIFKQRKRKRSCVLMNSIPVVLCISLYAAFTLPSMMRTESPDCEAGNAVTEEQHFELDSITTSADAIKVFGLDVSNYYTEPENVARITSLIGGILAQPETSVDDETAENFSDTVQDNSLSTAVTYTIIITKGNSTVKEYILAGDTLIDRWTLESYKMTAQEMRALREALGIPTK